MTFNKRFMIPASVAVCITAAFSGSADASTQSEFDIAAFQPVTRECWDTENDSPKKVKRIKKDGGIECEYEYAANKSNLTLG